MKYLIISFFLFISSSNLFAQEIVVKLLNSSEDSIVNYVNAKLPNYELYRHDSDTSDNFVKRLEFSLKKDSTSETGILVYLFYFETLNIDKCTGIRVVWYDEKKFKYSFHMLTPKLKKLSVNQWFDEENNIVLSTFFADKGNGVAFYFMDIQPYLDK